MVFWVGQGHFQAFVVGQSHSKIFGGTRSFQGLLVGHNHSKDFDGLQSFQRFGWTMVILGSLGWARVSLMILVDQSFQRFGSTTIILDRATVIPKILVGHGHSKDFSGPRSFLVFLWLGKAMSKYLVEHGDFNVFWVGHSLPKDFGGPRSFSGFFSLVPDQDYSPKLFFRLVWLGSHSKDFGGPRSFF